MRKSAIAASALIATGLFGVGGTAFADSGGPAPSPDGGEDANPGTTQEVQPPTETQAGADGARSVISLNVPVAADLHEGVANNLNISDVAHDAVHVGDSDASGASNAAGPGDGGNADTNPGDANADARGGVDAAAVNVGGTVDNVAATATSTVNGVASAVSLGGHCSVQGN